MAARYQELRRGPNSRSAVRTLVQETGHPEVTVRYWIRRCSELGMLPNSGPAPATKGLSAKSVWNIHICLRAALNDAVEDGLLRSTAPARWPRRDYHVSTTSRAIPEPASTKGGRRPGSAKSLDSKRASRTSPASGVKLSSFLASTIPRAPPTLNETRALPLGGLVPIAYHAKRRSGRSFLGAASMPRAGQAVRPEMGTSNHGSPTPSGLNRSGAKRLSHQRSSRGRDEYCACGRGWQPSREHRDLAQDEGLLLAIPVLPLLGLVGDHYGVRVAILLTAPASLAAIAVVYMMSRSIDADIARVSEI